ncbi:MAG TPA: hypothetical protein VF183_12115 [Acidimicrobiales bacterium]
MDDPMDVPLEPLGHLVAAQLRAVEREETQCGPLEGFSMSAQDCDVLGQRDPSAARDLGDPLVVWYALICAVWIQLAHQDDRMTGASEHPGNVVSTKASIDEEDLFLTRRVAAWRVHATPR